MELGKPSHIERREVILHDAAILLLVGFYDSKIALPKQLRTVYGFTAPEVSLALRFNHFGWHIEANHTIDPSSPCRVDVVVGALGLDVVAEEPRRLCAGVGDQCLLVGEVKFEVIAQPLLDLPLDRFGFLFWASEAEDEVG